MSNPKKHPRIRKDDLVECVFLDHCEDGDALECTVWGKVREISATKIVVMAWVSDGDPENEKLWTIVRKAVTKLVRLLPAK